MGSTATDAASPRGSVGARLLKGSPVLMNGIAFGGWYTKYQPSARFLSNGQGIGEGTPKFHGRSVEFFHFGVNRNDGFVRHKVIAACTNSSLHKERPGHDPRIVLR